MLEKVTARSKCNKMKNKRKKTSSSLFTWNDLYMCNMDTVTTHRWQGSKRPQVTGRPSRDTQCVFVLSHTAQMSMTVYSQWNVFSFAVPTLVLSPQIILSTILFYVQGKLFVKSGQTIEQPRKTRNQVVNWFLFCDTVMIYALTCFIRIPETDIL